MNTQETTVTLREVREAFDTLLEVVGRECDSETTRIVYWAGEDVLRILTGEWVDESQSAPVLSADKEEEPF